MRNINAGTREQNKSIEDLHCTVEIVLVSISPKSKSRTGGAPLVNFAGEKRVGSCIRD